MVRAEAMHLREIHDRHQGVRVRLTRLLGAGGFSEIYQTEDGRAVKVESTRSGKRHLANETRVLQALQGVRGVPRVFEFGETERYTYLFMEELGTSIKDEFSARGPNDPRAVAQVGLEMLKAIESVHRAGFVHRDIKPGNFCFRGHSHGEVVLIDFGLACDINSGRDDEGKFRGTTKFASFNAHDRRALTPADDLVSFMYMLVDLVNGELPWSQLCRDHGADKRKIATLKERESHLLGEGLPAEYAEIVDIVVTGAERGSQPDYQRIKALLEQAARGGSGGGGSTMYRGGAGRGYRGPSFDYDDYYYDDDDSYDYYAGDY